MSSTRCSRILNSVSSPRMPAHSSRMTAPRVQQRVVEQQPPPRPSLGPLVNATETNFDSSRVEEHGWVCLSSSKAETRTSLFKSTVLGRRSCRAWWLAQLEGYREHKTFYLQPFPISPIMTALCFWLSLIIGGLLRRWKARKAVKILFNSLFLQRKRKLNPFSEVKLYEVIWSHLSGTDRHSKWELSLVTFTNIKMAVIMHLFTWKQRSSCATCAISDAVMYGSTLLLLHFFTFWQLWKKIQMSGAEMSFPGRWHNCSLLQCSSVSLWRRRQTFFHRETVVCTS